ncbi:type III secretion system effector NleG7 [Escherichia coli]|nr:type III secretion system effector NleG7 [Escherichia coli]
MPIFLNFTAGSILPENELASLRYIVQQNQNDTVIIKERYKMDIRYIESVNGFTVNPVCSNHFSIFMARQNTIARNLEQQINNGRSFAQISQDFILQLSSNIGWKKGAENALKNKIHSHSFVVNPDEFSCDTQFLKCPITLCVPEKGVFVKNALNSNICTLYDKSAFMNLTREHLPHPLSREKIVKEMIIERNMCYFDTISQHFIIMDADQQKQHCK